MKRILCSWIGGGDWFATETQGQKTEPGAIARTIEDADYTGVDEIRLLNNYPDRQASAFRKWVRTRTKANVVCEDVALDSPTDFRGVYDVTDALIQRIESDTDEEHELIFLCSPGTYVMSSVWIILAHTKYPARLIEASKEAGVVEIEVPFDISVDYLIDRADRARRDVSGGLRVDAPEFNDIIHDCRPMRNAVARAQRIAPRSISVLIEGLSGTGKELFATAIHRQSRRHERPLVTVNCGSIPEGLLEMELFGSETEDPLAGTTKRKRGRFEQANHSTLFLDEVSELPPNIQVRLLRTIEDGEFTRVGGTRSIKADIRYISATNRKLNEEVAAGRFRADLFYRLAEDVISLPTLRNRQDDVSLIVRHLLPRLVERLGYVTKQLNAGALNVLKKYPFPGNVRELSNVLVRAIVHSERNSISKSDIENALSIAPMPDDAMNLLDTPLNENFRLNEHLDTITRHFIERAREESDNNLGKASELLGFTNYQTLSSRIKKLGIDW